MARVFVVAWHNCLRVRCDVDKTIFSDEYRLLIDRLKEARKGRGVTQLELAKQLRTDQAYVSKIERCERRVDVIELRSICSVLGLDFVEFIRGFEAELKKHGK